MQKGSSKRGREAAAPRNVRNVARRNEDSTGTNDIEITEAMRAAAAAFGRMGGRIGGRIRAEKLSAAKRSEIAKRAAATRWAKKSD